VPFKLKEKRRKSEKKKKGKKGDVLPAIFCLLVGKRKKKKRGISRGRLSCSDHLRDGVGRKNLEGGKDEGGKGRERLPPGRRTASLPFSCMDDRRGGREGGGGREKVAHQLLSTPTLSGVVLKKEGKKD